MNHESEVGVFDFLKIPSDIEGDRRRQLWMRAVLAGMESQVDENFLPFLGSPLCFGSFGKSSGGKKLFLCGVGWGLICRASPFILLF